MKQVNKKAAQLGVGDLTAIGNLIAKALNAIQDSENEYAVIPFKGQKALVFDMRGRDWIPFPVSALSEFAGDTTVLIHKDGNVSRWTINEVLEELPTN